MPLYDFDCPKCGHCITNVWVPDEGPHRGKRWIDCPYCKEMAKRQETSKRKVMLDSHDPRENIYRKE